MSRNSFLPSVNKGSEIQRPNHHPKELSAQKHGSLALIQRLLRDIPRKILIVDTRAEEAVDISTFTSNCGYASDEQVVTEERAEDVLEGGSIVGTGGELGIHLAIVSRQHQPISTIDLLCELLTLAEENFAQSVVPVERVTTKKKLLINLSDYG